MARVIDGRRRAVENGMSIIALPREIGVWFMRAAWLLAALAAFAAGSARAQDDPPGRVGRLAETQGQVWWYDHDDGQWTEAQRNRPLTGGDRISTAPEARAELRIGSTVLRLGAVTELEVLQLDDERMRFQLHSGSLALRVRSREVAEEIELVTAEARLRPVRSGHYRLDRLDDTSHAGSWRGTLRIDEAGGFEIDTGQRVELWREGIARELRHAGGSLPNDDFADWVAAADLQDERSAATRHVSPEMTGAEDLDRYGRWDNHPDYGVVWYPYEVRAGWAPYRHGTWVWVRPWGWTWVDEARWGFAPFHYGRWVHWRGRWGWWPGSYVARPVYAPALVGWVGDSNWGVSVNVGGPAIGWVPLAPREVFVPWYRHTPVYVDRINRRPHMPGRKPVPQLPTGPARYGNQGVPGAVTVVPRDVLVRRQPMPPAVVAPPAAGSPRQPWVGVAPPSAPVPRADGRAQRPGPPQPAWRDGWERPPDRDRDRTEPAGSRSRPQAPLMSVPVPSPAAAGPTRPAHVAPAPPAPNPPAAAAAPLPATATPPPAAAVRSRPPSPYGPAVQRPASPAEAVQAAPRHAPRPAVVNSTPPPAPAPASPAPRPAPPPAAVQPPQRAEPAPGVAPPPSRADPAAQPRERGERGDERQRNTGARNHPRQEMR